MNPKLTAYPEFKRSYSHKELEQCFTPTFEEKLFVEQHAHPDSPVHALIFMLLLKCYQCLGRPISLKKIPDIVKEHVAQQMNQPDYILPKIFSRATKRRYLKRIRHYLGINIDQDSRKKIINDTINNYAKIRNDTTDIVNAVLDILIKSHFELPPLNQMIRQTKSALHQANEKIYFSIDQQLNDKAKTAIELLLKKKSIGDNSEWFYAKQEIAQPTIKKTKEFIQQFQKLIQLKILLPINSNHIAPAKILTFYHEAESIDAGVFNKMKSHKRNALVALYLNHKAALTLDDFCHVLTRWLNKIHHNATELLKQYYVDHSDDADEMIDTLHTMLRTLNSEESPAHKVDIIMVNIPDSIETMMEKCEKHKLYAGGNHYPFTLQPYKNKRRGIFDLLEQLNLKSTYNDNKLLNAVKIVLSKRHHSSKALSLNSEDEKYPIDLDLLPDKLKRTAVNNENGTIIRHYYEFGIFTRLLDEINCGDIFISNAYDYNDPNISLISWEEFNKHVDTYCNITQLPRDKNAFVQSVKSLLTKQADITDQNFPDNKSLHIISNKVYIKKAKAEGKSDKVDAIDDAINKRISPVTIIDVLRDVDQWIGLSSSLKTSAEYQSKIESIPERYAATLYAYGCNVGPVQASFSLNDFSRKQVASLFNYHFTEPRIDAMSTRVVNFYNRFLLPKYWGDGSSVSVDGTYWEMYTSNLLAAHHIRYGKYGGLGYYHVSDQYIALYSNFLTCGVHEGSYLIDGIIENVSDIQPRIVHGDTGAQSEIVFALCFLLGIKLMPRIRNLKHLNYYKANRSDTFECIDDIFCSSNIDWKKNRRLLLRHVKNCFVDPTGENQSIYYVEKI